LMTWRVVVGYPWLKGPEWRRAVSMKNRFGETPADQLTAVVEEMEDTVAAAADRPEAAAAGKGTSPAAEELRARLAAGAYTRPLLGST
jgi:hypothetical protein